MIGGHSEPAHALTGELELVLYDALPRDAQQSEDRANLLLYMVADEGRWRRVWGKAFHFSIGEHFGLVDKATVTDEKIEIELSLLVVGDFWRKGEWPAFLTLTLDRKADGRVEGRYSGQFDGHPIGGRIEGELMPRRPLRPGFTPPEPDERPRVLFRKSDLPALRAKLDTRFGQAYLAAIRQREDSLSLGMLYQLTGDEAYARRAMEWIQRQYPNQVTTEGFGSGGFGHEIFAVALTYDLCCEAWPADFRARIRRELEELTDRRQYILMTNHANFHPCSNYYGPARGIAAMTAMVLWGEKGPAPRAPRNPIERARIINARDNYRPGKGVGITELVPGELPTSGWIWSGRLPAEVSRDVLTQLGGYERATPGEGSESTYTTPGGGWFVQKKLTFSQLPDEAAGESGIDLAKTVGGGEGSVSVYFTAIRVTEEKVVGYSPTSEHERTFLSGMELDPDLYYRLRPGVHTVLIEARVPRGRGTVGPKFTLATNDPTQSTALGVYSIQRRLWERDQALWKETGIDTRHQFWVERGWFQVYQHYRWGIGDGGFKAETGGYSNISSFYPTVYAGVHRNFVGRAASPHPDVSHLMPRQIMQMVFPESGRPRTHAINSVVTVDQHWLASAFSAIPSEYQPSALWVWNRLADVNHREDAGNVFTATGGRGGNALALTQAFINYPLGMDPIHPDEGMPRHWRADTFGHYVSRSGFRDGDDFVGQVFLKAAPIVGWNHPNAGAVHFAGMGSQWTTTRSERGGARENYSVVLLPDDDINQSGNARLTHLEKWEDGSMSLTMDMAYVYARRSQRFFDSMFIPMTGVRPESNITGLRAVAFDYSGKSGAPAMIVMVDSIRGGGRKLWTWQLPSVRPTITDRGFRFTQDGSTLNAIFIQPASLSISAGTEEVEIGAARTAFHGTLRRATAEGGDDFFVIMTINRNDEPTPEVKVDGQGPDARVTIGERTVRFDGKRIILGDTTDSER
ncbi:MAG: hypothetical protein JJU36_04060 [Phycisphaeraceae bacterium]|nr:hypothetical protein [Phycisphaeraceae bacterium]